MKKRTNGISTGILIGLKDRLYPWYRIIIERFPPEIYVPFLSLYFFAHYFFSVNVLNSTTQVSSVKTVALFVATILFYFTLRLYDEIKDYEVDIKIYPERPLPRGLLTHKAIYTAIFILLLLQLLVYSLFGIKALFAAVIPLLYSILMFREFFVRKWIRRRLTLYALSHTFVSTLYSLAILATLVNTAFFTLDSNALLFALLSWCVFNIFEFSRKSFVSSEERKGVDSYSKLYGVFGASMLVISVVLASLFLINNLEFRTNELVLKLVSFFSLLLIIVSITFATFDRPPLGKIYRFSTSAFIAAVYIIFIAVTIT